MQGPARLQRLKDALAFKLAGQIAEAVKAGPNPGLGPNLGDLDQEQWHEPIVSTSDSRIYREEASRLGADEYVANVA